LSWGRENADKGFFSGGGEKVTHKGRHFGELYVCPSAREKVARRSTEKMAAGDMNTKPTDRRGLSAPQKKKKGANEKRKGFDEGFCVGQTQPKGAA